MLDYVTKFLCKIGLHTFLIRDKELIIFSGAHTEECVDCGLTVRCKTWLGDVTETVEIAPSRYRKQS